MFKRIAIINRGEAAMRLISAVRELSASGADVTTIAFTTDAEPAAKFAREADEVFDLGSAAERPYLNHQVLAAALREVEADAVWVGWGFVAEDPAFADLMDQMGITFIGPSGDAMRALGDKIGSKLLAEEVGVPVAPWSGGGLDTLDEAIAAAEKIGYPLMLKATAGGGGRGIRRVTNTEELRQTYQRTRDEAQRAFGSGVVFLESLVPDSRHIEVQLISDGETAWALGVRDCTIQRKNQKIIEESASPVLTAEQTQQLRESAERLLLKVGYRGAATVEFLYQPSSQQFAFLEVNTRLQVEHPVTETVCTFDLVKAQIHVAQGGKLENRPTETGHAIEIRLNAEDPDRDFAPAPGIITRMDLPSGPGIRVDSGFAEGDVIPADFDSMIAKIIASGRDRDEALARLRRAVAETTVLIEGGVTNKSFVLELLNRAEVIDGTADTGWIDRARSEGDLVVDHYSGVALVAAAIAAYDEAEHLDVTRLIETSHGGRPQASHKGQYHVELKLRGVSAACTIYRIGRRTYRVRVGDDTVDANIMRLDQTHARLKIGDQTYRIVIATDGPVHNVEVNGTTHRVSRDEGGVLRAPAPALVVATPAAVGTTVEAGQVVLVLESMKMETPLLAPFAGTVREVLVSVGSQVESLAPLMRLEATGDDEALDGDIGFSLPTVPEVSAADDLIPALRALRAELLGFDGDPLDPALARYLAARQASNQQVSESEIDVVRLFSDLAEVGRNRPREEQEDTTLLVHSDREYFHSFLRYLDTDRAKVPQEFTEKLLCALRHYGVESLDRTEALEHALFRIFLAQQKIEDNVDAILALLGQWIAGPAPSEELATVARAELNRLKQATQRRFPTIGDLARSVRFRWFDQPQGFDADEATGLYELADREVLWRLSEFNITELPAPDGVLLWECVAKTNPRDKRLLAVSQVLQAPINRDYQGRLLGAPHAERAIERCLEAIRRNRASLGVAGAELDRNHVWVYIHPVIEVDFNELEPIQQRMTPLTDDAGIEDVLVLGQFATRGGQPHKLVARFHARLSGGVGLSVEPPPTEPLAPLGDYDSKVIRSRRRGLTYPYELLDQLAGGGNWTELDIVDGTLREVDRAPGLNSSGIIVSRVTTRTELHPDGITRIVLCGDPTRHLGAIAEDECRRVIEAINLAEAEGIPLEWFAISSGARISMSSGVENMDWVAAALRRIVEFTQDGGEINIIVAGINVGAQPYWNAEATMLMHTRGILVMTPDSAMVLTGKQSLDFSGGVSAEDNYGLGGYDRVMGPNGQAQYWARDLAGAVRILMSHYDSTWIAPGDTGPRRAPTSDPSDRDISDFPHPNDKSPFTTVGQIFSEEHNKDRKKPFDIRTVIEAVADQDHGRLERWAGMADAETAVVMDARIGGHSVMVLGVESKSVARAGLPPSDGPDTWTSGTLFPRSSKKVARALNACSGNRPVVVLANLSGFDGSPESMRNLQLEYGAEIGRAIINFDGPIVFVVISRYHGGAFVVFSKALNENMTVLAVEGSFASVIGGAPAAAVVFAGEVAKRTSADPRVAELEEQLRSAHGKAKASLARELDELRASVRSEKINQLAAEFDAVHSVERAVAKGAVDRIITPDKVRSEIIAILDQAAKDSKPTTSGER